MLALAGAAVFALSLILDWADVKTSDAFTPQTLVTLGLLLVALHLGGVGTTYKTRSFSRSGRRR